MWPLSLEDVAFEQAIAWFQAKTLITRTDWDALAAHAREKAFMVSGVAQLDVIEDVWQAIDDALVQGTTFREFQKAIRPKLEAAWAGSVKNPAWRMETIFRTNVQAAYSAGRWRQIQSHEVQETHPYLRYDAILDDRITVVCRRCNGTVLAADHPFWKTHVPPLHFNCRSAVVPLTPEDAWAAGLTHEGPAVDAQQGFGLEPDVSQWQPDPEDYPEALWDIFKKKPRSPLAQEAPPPAPPPPRSEVILGEKLAGPSGSNDGGLFLGTDGVKRYVKFYADPTQAKGEHLANQLYRDLGFEAPASELFEHEGRVAYASVIVEGTTTLGKAGLTKERAKSVLDGFAADVLVGNWDAVGLSLDNVLLLESGKPLRVDNGGCFLFRAKGGRKPTTLLNDITEWDRLRDTSVNPAYASVLRAAGGVGDRTIKTQAVKGIQAILDLRKRHVTWANYLDDAIPELVGDDKATIAAMLEARTEKLKEKLALLTKKTQRRVRETRSNDVVFDVSKGDGKKVYEWLKRVQYDGLSAKYDALFKGQGLAEDEILSLRGDISEWTGEYRSGSRHQQLYAAFAALNDPNAPKDGKLVRHLGRVREGRKERWRWALAEAGVEGPPPTHLQIHRGMGGVEWVEDVARAWADDAVEHVTLRSHELASWSLSADTARKFARKNANNNAFFSWKVPIEAPIYDQVADDAGFVTSYFSEHEVIAGPGHDRGQSIPKQNVTLTYRGKKYTFAKRNELIEAMRKDGILS